MSRISKPELHKQWQQRISEYRQSNQTQSTWCSTNNVSIHQFKYWLKKMEGKVPSQKPSSKWVPVSIEERAELASNPIEIKIGEATLVVKPGYNSDLLVDVIQTLRNL